MRGLALGGALTLAATATLSQEGGGVLFTFGVDQRFSWADNPDLTIPASADRFRSDTRLSFGLVSETPRDRLELGLATLLRGEDSGSSDFGFVNSSADLSYTRSGISSSFTAAAFWRESDLGDGLSLVEVAEGEPPVLIFEEGTARNTGARLSYSWGDGAPFGGTLRASLSDTDYNGTTDPDLVDSRVVTFGSSLRFALNEVTDATLDIGYRQYDEAGPAPLEDSTTLTLGLTRALPRGSLNGRLSSTRDDDGTRTSLSFGHSFDLPRGAVSVDLGMTREAGGGTDVTGALSWRQELVNGALSARLRRSVENGTDNETTLVTAFSLGLAQTLTPRIGLNLGASWTRSEETGSGDTSDNASLEASLSYALTEDWAMNFGANHRLKDETPTGRADSTSVFLSLGRKFEWRP